MKSSYSNILLLLLGIFLACDRISDTPEPNNFQTLVLNSLSVKPNSGSGDFSFNLLDSNALIGQYTIKIGEAVHGTVSAAGQPGAYNYTPNAGFSGLDSVRYEICLQTNCKTSWIYFQVPPPACFVSARPDSFSVFLSNRIQLPAMQNDELCTNGKISIVAQPDTGFVQLESNQFELFLPFGWEGQVQFRYQIKNGADSSSALVKVNVQLPPGYCNDRFRAEPDTLPLLPGFNFKTFTPEQLYANDIKCSIDAQIQGFAIVPSPPSNETYELKFQQNRWWFLVKKPQDFTSGTFKYRVCANSGKCDTTTVVIFKP